MFCFWGVLTFEAWDILKLDTFVLRTFYIWDIHTYWACIDFFNGACFLQFNVCQIFFLTALALSIRNSNLLIFSGNLLRIQRYNCSIIIFLTVCDHNICNDLRRKFIFFIPQNIIKGEVFMIEMFCYLPMTTELQRQSLYFVLQCKDIKQYTLKSVKERGRYQLFGTWWVMDCRTRSPICIRQAFAKDQHFFFGGGGWCSNWAP
jgi:hypothetical protein